MCNCWRPNLCYCWCSAVECGTVCHQTLSHVTQYHGFVVNSKHSCFDSHTHLLCFSLLWLAVCRGPCRFLPLHHRLNGSSSHVLTATSHSYGKAKNSTHHRIETHNLIKIKLARLITSARRPTVQNFMQIRPWGASRQMGEIYTQKFIFIYTFFQKLTYRSDPSADFTARWLKRRGLTQGCAFWGLKNSELIFDP